MSNLENSFLLAVERAELDKVGDFLDHRHSSGLDVNCRDPLDRNALIICIHNRNLEVIRLLLTRADNIRVGDALLYAVQENFVEAVELLIGQLPRTTRSDPGKRTRLLSEEAEHRFFSCDMTPLMLAAQNNNLEIVKLLLDRNVSPIPNPHDPRCGCSACCQARSHDCLKHSRARINAYKALSSPSMIALASSDPLKTAFRTSAKLEKLAQLEPEYKEDYMRLRSQCQAFATKLLDYTRTSKELEILLDFNGYDQESSFSEDDDDNVDSEANLELRIRGGGGGAGSECERAPSGHHRAGAAKWRKPSRLARLKQAIECKQKTFCAHPNIQELLATLWYENLPGFRQMSVLNQTLQVLCIGLLFPFYSLAYLVAPNSQLGLYIKKPFIKFICHSASYITFITLLVLASQRVEAFYSWSSVVGLFVAGGNESSLALASTAAGLEGSNFSLFSGNQQGGGGGGESAQQVPPSGASGHLGADDDLRQLGQLAAIYKQRLKTVEGGAGSIGDDEFGGARGLDSLRKIFDELPASSKKRGTAPSPIESIILVWVVSLMWAELKQIRALGMNYYKYDMWNLLDSVASGCYLGTIILRVVSYCQAAADVHLQDEPREHWNAYDPTLLSEGLFATATIFSSLKLVYIFSVNPYLGPLQIGLGRMIIDILRFSWIYMLVLFAFACGMNQLLWYYADLERHHLLSEHNVDQYYKAKHFSNVFESSQTLFWANFGLVDLENFDLMGIRQYTRFWALLMFGCYCFINVIVVLNLLIAMMNHSYVKISTRSDIEWKFARTRLWMSYFENGSTVPAPFNVIPSIKSLRSATKRLLRPLLVTRRPKHAPASRARQQQAMAASGGGGGTTYDVVIRSLVRRYLIDQQRQRERASALTEEKLCRWSELKLFSSSD